MHAVQGSVSDCRTGSRVCRRGVGSWRERCSTREASECVAQGCQESVSMGVIEIIANLLKIASSPGGLAVVQRMFDEGGITKEKTVAILANLPKPTTLPGDM
jgi:hypothetical protein